MKVILDKDIIVTLTTSDKGVEVGVLPIGVGIERLRWNGEKLIDLLYQQQFFVEKKYGVFILHVIPVDNSQLVTMSYKDRKFLVEDGGVYRLKTQQEVQDEETLNTILRFDTVANIELRREFGTRFRFELIIILLLFAIIVFLFTPNATLKDRIQTFFEGILDDIQNTIPLVKVEGEFPGMLVKLRTILTKYFSNIGSL